MFIVNCDIQVLAKKRHRVRCRFFAFPAIGAGSINISRLWRDASACSQISSHDLNILLT